VNRLAFGFGLSLFLFFNSSTNAQENRTSGNNASAVGVTVTNYIEAYYTGDAARMEQTLHPHGNLAWPTSFVVKVSVRPAFTSARRHLAMKRLDPTTLAPSTSESASVTECVWNRG
jgi:hypothetical protein